MILSALSQILTGVSSVLLPNVVIVKRFEKCVFVLRTERLIWETEPTESRIMCYQSRKAKIRLDSYLTLLLFSVIGIFLLISCYCFVGWQKDLYP